ncbi:hypothetical protein Sp245p_01430 [Azospirillum baldaniorum]|uniref:Uncharacterized protein n=1 Tax=Azospirillum baldaniorum TaxID=1064539 RepID=A0A9P1JN79_9PROT|nr:hypothetical protein [Azospirillum baldaniorum]AWJ88534.1 hypothetical protein Sp245p_01430 [Azospirillum baldaniorum]TWA79943.1 hypothetical protein FBZ85_104283 [Azospirillum brasilense]CCC96531.1 protein of unknown function [Azospirillum baldaniorum]
MSGEQSQVQNIKDEIAERYPDVTLSDATARRFARVLETLDADLTLKPKKVEAELSDALAAIRAKR